MTFARHIARIALLLSLVPACTTGSTVPRRDAGDDGGAMIIEGCDATRDADSDGVADDAEGTSDVDMDGMPNDRDEDSDGDGILDVEEHGPNHPCSRPDADRDGIANWADRDSDNDGLSDQEERSAYSTNPYERDTDGDGVTDLGEARGTMTDPTDPTSTIPPDDFFVVLPYNGGHEMRDLDFGTTISRADVYFLIDTTGSMQASIDNVTGSLTTIASELSSRIRDVQMGVGQHKDFPNGAHCSLFDFACLTSSYGGMGDMAYENRQDITDSVGAVQSALAGLSAAGGADGPESQVEALYQTATGEGGSWTFTNGAPPHSLAPRRCPFVPDEIGTRRGYPCFRPGALPIVVLVSDVDFHNGTSPAANYAGINPPPHTLAQAIGALNGIGARMIGVSVGPVARPDMEAVARMTGTVDTAGRPLVYDATGGTVSTAIIEGISTLVGGTPQDVTTATEDLQPNPDGVDARGFVKSIVAIEGYASDGTPGPNPGVSYTSHDDTTFYAVVPGTRLDFRVDFHNDFVMPPPTAQIYRAVIVVIGNGVARLDERQVYIIVPPDGAIILI
jgi:hypothetical protein